MAGSYGIDIVFKAKYKVFFGNLCRDGVSVEGVEFVTVYASYLKRLSVEP